MGVFMLIFVSSYTIMTLNKVHMEFYFHFHVYTQYTNTFLLWSQARRGLVATQTKLPSPKANTFQINPAPICPANIKMYKILLYS